MESVIGTKSFNFAVRIVNLYKYLTQQKKEYILSKQLLRSGTSIGANVAEAKQAQSKPDFVSKMNISLKETAEKVSFPRLSVIKRTILSSTPERERPETTPPVST